MRFIVICCKFIVLLSGCALQRLDSSVNEKDWLPKSEGALVLVDETEANKTNWSLEKAGLSTVELEQGKHQPWMHEVAKERASEGYLEEFVQALRDRRHQVLQFCSFADPSFTPNRGQDEYQLDFKSDNSEWHKLIHQEKGHLAYVLYWVHHVEGFHINSGQRNTCKVSFRNFTYSPEGDLVPTIPGDLTPLLTPYPTNQI